MLKPIGLEPKISMLVLILGNIGDYTDMLTEFCIAAYLQDYLRKD